MIRAALDESWINGLNTALGDEIGISPTPSEYEDDMKDIMSKYNCGTCRNKDGFSCVALTLSLTPDDFCCNQWKEKE